MYEFEVKLNNGIAIVLAQNWDIKANTIYFYQYNHVVKQFPSETVKSIQKTWPEVGEVWINE